MDADSLLTDRERLDLDLAGAEHLDAGRPLLNRRPAVQRVVIAVDDEGPYACFIEALEPGEEAQLRSHSAVGAIVDVASDEQEGRLALDGEGDDVVPSLQRRFLKRLRYAGRRPGDSLERRIEMQIGRVDKSECT